jgi:cytochrome c oxidase subunit I
MVCLINSSLLGAVNFITTIIQLRAKGLSWMRLPFLCLGAICHGLPAAAGFPPLEAAAVLQLMDNLLRTSFFLPTGLVVSGQPLHISGGGSPLLWQHLFWFLAHPEVYVLILPAWAL